MKRNLIAFTAIIGILAGGFFVAHGEPNKSAAPAAENNSNPAPPPPRQFGPGGPGAQHGEFMLNRLAERLNLTPEQKAKVQPILDQTRPQIQQIHEEAMEKMRSVMEGTMGQIRPILTPEQQAKLDQFRQAQEKMHEAMKQMHSATGE